MEKVLSRLAQVPLKELVDEPKMILNVPLEHFELMINILHTTEFQEWAEENADEYALVLFEYMKDLNEKVMHQTRDLSAPHLKKLIHEFFTVSGMDLSNRATNREYQEVCELAIKNLHKFRSPDMTVKIFIDPELVSNYISKCVDHYGKSRMDDFLVDKGILSA